MTESAKVVCDGAELEVANLFDALTDRGPGKWHWFMLTDDLLPSGSNERANETNRWIRDLLNWLSDNHDKVAPLHHVVRNDGWVGIYWQEK